jgi:hypothetical protein
MMSGSTMMMLFILLILYIYSFCRVRNGSGLADVKLISILLIISSIAAVVLIGTQYAMTGYTQDYA